jgi:hypothetical protein
VSRFHKLRLNFLPALVLARIGELHRFLEDLELSSLFMRTPSLTAENTNPEGWLVFLSLARNR